MIISLPKILLGLIGGHTNYIFVPAQPDMWKKCLDCIEELQTILFEHNNIFIGENIAEDSENLANTDQVCTWIWNKYDDV